MIKTNHFAFFWSGIEKDLIFISKLKRLRFIYNFIHVPFMYSHNFNNALPVLNYICDLSVTVSVFVASVTLCKILHIRITIKTTPFIFIILFRCRIGGNSVYNSKICTCFEDVFALTSKRGDCNIFKCSQATLYGLLFVKS